MVSRSFKNDLSLRPLRYRTPSPPRYAYEYGSPKSRDYSPITPKFKDKSVENAVEAQSINHIQKRSHESMRRGSDNVMEAFASIALATTADRAFRQTDPFYSPIFHASPERPHKRSRSEKLPSPHHARKSSRPFTSYAQPSTDPDRERDAALLLNFFQEARSNASTAPTGWHQDNFYRSPTAESVTLIGTTDTTASARLFQGSESKCSDFEPKQHIVNHPILGEIIENGVVYEHIPQEEFGGNETHDHSLERRVLGAQKTPEASAIDSAVSRASEVTRFGSDEPTQNDMAESVPTEESPVDQPIMANENQSEQATMDIDTAVVPAAAEKQSSLRESDILVKPDTTEATLEVEPDVVVPSISEEQPILQSPQSKATEDLLAAGDAVVQLDPSTDKPLESPRPDEERAAESPKDQIPSTLPIKSRQSVLPSVCASCKFTRNTLTIDTENNATSWICCDACKDWYHFACAGFKSEREVRGVDKYRCKTCKPKHGATTFVRKSARAHTSIDYAGLHEGVVKTSDENPEHHYIKPIKEGVIKFNPENFARMHPSLVTLEYFEKGDGMKEPIVIPVSMNPRPQVVDCSQEGEGSSEGSTTEVEQTAAILDKWLAEGLECETVLDYGQDAMDMVMPQNLTVRQVSEMYGPDERLDVIDVKSQEGEDKRWTLKKWADYYESTGTNKKVRNVISLEVSHSKLGRLIRRPKVVRDLDLQDSVWPTSLKDKGEFPKVQFYCLMSVADCFTDFHIDFGGSSVFYHILKGKKTFFFIPPHEKHLKSYEEWCKSPAQNWTFLGDQTKECYRVDLSEGDTMLIPSGWIHAVWTPEDSLVIGGNFLTRLHFDMQMRVVQIEKATNVIMKFRYPFFQKIMWFTALKYLEDDPLPESVMEELVHGGTFAREIETYNEFDTGESLETSEERSHARYYSKAELDGLPGLARYLQRTALIAAGKITDGIPEKTRAAVRRSIPKGHGEPIDVVKKFTIWAYWKRGNEPIPHWAYPDYVPEAGAPEVAEKKLSAKTLRRLDREAALQAFRIAPSRQSARMKSQQQGAETESNAGNNGEKNGERKASTTSLDQSNQTVDLAQPHGHGGDSPQKTISVIVASESSGTTLPANAEKKKRKSTGSPPKRRKLACETCRKRRRACKHGEATALASYQAPNLDVAPSPSVESSTIVDAMGAADSIQVQIPQTPTTEPLVPTNSTSPSVETKAKMLHVEIVRRLPDPMPAVTSDEHDKSPGTEAIVTGQVLDPSGTIESPANHSENQVRTPGRSKACLDCRKSKRRCIHDENGQEDPVKANEAVIPRPSASKKRKADGDGLPKTPTKKLKNSISTTGPFSSQNTASSISHSGATVEQTPAQAAPVAFMLGSERQSSPAPMTTPLQQPEVPTYLDTDQHPTTTTPAQQNKTENLYFPAHDPRSPPPTAHHYAFSEDSPEPVHLIPLKPEPQPEIPLLHNQPTSSLVSPPASNHTDNERYTPVSTHTDPERDSPPAPIQPTIPASTTPSDAPPPPTTKIERLNPTPFLVQRSSSFSSRRPSKPLIERYTPESAPATITTGRRASSSAATTTCDAGRRASQSSLSSLDSEALTLRTSASPALKEGTPGAVGGGGSRKRKKSDAGGAGGTRRKARNSLAEIEDPDSRKLIREMQAQDLGLRRRR